MSEFDQDQLDAHQEMMLKDHLSAELDPQLGRAEDRFRQFLRDESDPHQNPYRIGGRFRGWTFSIAGAALAACLGFLWAGPTLSTQPPSRQQDPVNATTVDLPWMEQSQAAQTYDGGIQVDADGNPVRVLHHMQWDRTRWFDQDKQLRAEQVVPHDNVVYVQMKTY
jgi:hypothetical protein